MLLSDFYTFYKLFSLKLLLPGTHQKSDDKHKDWHSNSYCFIRNSVIIIDVSKYSPQCSPPHADKDNESSSNIWKGQIVRKKCIVVMGCPFPVYLLNV